MWSKKSPATPLRPMAVVYRRELDELEHAFRAATRRADKVKPAEVVPKDVPAQTSVTLLAIGETIPDDWPPPQEAVIPATSRAVDKEEELTPLAASLVVEEEAEIVADESRHTHECGACGDEMEGDGQLCHFCKQAMKRGTLGKRLRESLTQ